MIPLPAPPKVVKKEGSKAIFEFDGLYPGYGVTVGNALRRVLLSSLEGAAATQVKIKNVPHEFSTLPGIMEDVISLMLNLKALRFKIFSDEPQKVTLKIKGEKEVKGSDFEIPSQLELVNPTCHIASLTDKSAELEMEILIERGIGYSPRDTRKKQEKLEIGVIPMDAIFTPVRRVSFRVENIRVGERTDFDRLLLDVETDGTISPEAAFTKSAEILVQHFSLASGAFVPAEEKPAETVSAKKPAKKKKKSAKNPVAKKKK